MIDFEFTINMPWQTFFESLGTLPLNVDCQRRYTTLFKVILPSVTYAPPIWWCGTNKNEFNSLESMHCMAARVIYNLPHDMPSEDVRKTANWDSLFDTYKVKIATLIHNIHSRITPSCLEHIIQRKEHKYDLRHQHRVSAQRFETYYLKNSISGRGPIVWNILEPSAVSARDYTKRAKKAHALRNLNFNAESPQMGRPQIDRDFAFYWPYSYLSLYIFHFYWQHPVLIILFIFIIWLTVFTRPHRLY